MKSSPKAEPFRLRLGTALKCRREPFHRCLILSDPPSNGGQVVLMRITSDDGHWPDRDCVLTPADWDQLDHRSVVAYSTALCGRVEPALLNAIATGEFEVIASPALEVLRKVIACGRASEGMPPRAQASLVEI